MPRECSRLSVFILSALLMAVMFPIYQTDVSSDRGERAYRSRGNIIVVNASGGGDYTHIQWAVDNASDGDTVYVEAGIYEENIEIDKSIYLHGESQDRTKIIGEGRIVNLSANGVSVSGFTITGSTIPHEGIAIYLENVKNCNISGNNCSNNSYCGIFLENVTHTLVMGNICGWQGVHGDIVPSQGIGIFVNASSNISIRDNFCSYNTYRGIKIKTMVYSELENNYCVSNGGEHIIGVGISMSNSHNNTIISNNCSKNYSSGFLCMCGRGLDLLTSNGNLILNNKFISNNAGAIYLTGCNDCQITNNLCTDQFELGISLTKSNFIILNNNYITENCWGICIGNSSYNIIEGNHISENSEGIMLSSGSDNNVMVSNHFENNSNHYDSVYAINLDVFDIGYNLRNNRIHHNNFL